MVSFSSQACVSSDSPSTTSSSLDGDVPTSFSDIDSGYSDASIPDAELDGDELDPIVICGFSIKFPQDATSPDGLWKMMMEKRCAMTEFPPDRLNLDGFYQKSNRLNTIPIKGGHFMKDDLSVFDADFFSIAPTEANSMDPMQRWLLEAAYRALENAGMPMENVSGSRTAVYTGSFGFDYMLQLCRDPENPPMYAALGFGISMLANRLSWFFNLRGPSIGLDSACSSTAMGVDIACQALRNGSCDMAMVAGCNIANSPESYLWMSNIGFLSPDSRCHSFDHRANGYARGEGVGVVLLKRLSDALRDGNTIRAIIRSSASNEDGRTPGITQPSRAAQEQLIRETYQKSGLSMAHTRFFEAHGTGTAIGDPREAQAIGSAFRKYRSNDDPVYVGALKSNIGHLEGASGLAALVKAVLVLERGIIPPNANFEKLNPKIDAEFLKLKFPQEPCPWPTSGLRRASINSFGYGGANCHIVIDDAYNYLRLRALSGKHFTVPSPPNTPQQHSISGLIQEHQDLVQDPAPLKLLVWSSADKHGIPRMTTLLQDWYKSDDLHTNKFPLQHESLLDDLAYTLDSHRSQLPWRSFAILKSPTEIQALESRASSSKRVNTKVPRLGYVFSGQGGQWFAMGRELMSYYSFNAEIEEAEYYLRSLGCTWSVKGELLRTKETSRLDHPEFSQTLCTVLQVALVNLLRQFNVKPSAVVGHSSGEIAAAYAGGYLSMESAWKLAYYRGLCSAQLVDDSSSDSSGAMMSVGVSSTEAKDLVEAVNRDASTIGVSIACINSPTNVTISGESRLIDLLRAQLQARDIFARKLRVPVAYHSRQMELISERYTTMIGSLSGPLGVEEIVPMISSVTGYRIEMARLLQPSYWALNMTSTVRFTQAVTVMCEQSNIGIVKKLDRSHLHASVVDHLVELGPHAILQGPLRDILRASSREFSIGYNSLLRRGCCAVETLLQALGELYCVGYPVNVRAINTPLQGSQTESPRTLLVNLPEYPFDHSQRYWDESRLSKNYRLRSHAPSQLLGVQSRDWNASEARWRHFIHTAEIPWAEQHVINGRTLYPGAGMLVMAIEAAKQLAGKDHIINSYTLEDVYIEGPMDLSSGSLEVQTHLHQQQSRTLSEKVFDFTIRTWTKDDWLINCRGSISVELSNATDRWIEEKSRSQRYAIAQKLSATISRCQKPVDAPRMYEYLKHHGYKYGSVYQAAQQQRCDQKSKQATAKVGLFKSVEGDHVIHPVSLDAILHLSFTALTSGGLNPMATSIPHRIGYMWVSNTPEPSTVTACTNIQNVSKGGFICSGGALDNESTGELRLWYEDFELVNITSEPKPENLFPNPKQFCMNIESKPALNKLSPSEIHFLIQKSHPIKHDLSSFYQDVQLLVNITLEQLVKSVDPITLDSQDPWKKHYWNWAEYHLLRGHGRPQSSGANTSLQELSRRISRTSNMGRLYVEVASNLIDIFNGESNPLELLLKSGLLKKGYEEWAGYDCGKQAARYMDLLSHQSPGMNILEVGGGTAATTRNLTGALRLGTHNSARSLRCNRYDFTDISPAFLENAREEFAVFSSQMTFGTLNIDQNFAKQGYAEGYYDVVAADNVLHVTSDLGKTLRNVRKALKLGGKLVMHELVRPTGWTAGFIFGVFPGWWLGSEDGRTLSPNLSVQDWDAALKANGFSGVDIVFRDFEDDVAHQLGWLVATATGSEVISSPTTQPTERQQPLIVIDTDSKLQHLLSNDLNGRLHSLTGLESRIVDLATASAEINTIHEDALVVLMVDFGPSFLSSMDETTWKEMSSLVQKSRHLLWVSAGGGQSASPNHGILDGLARTLRSEFYQLHLVTVALDIEDATSDKANHLVEIAREMLTRTVHQNYEQDYCEVDGLLHTRRLVEANNLKLDIDAGVAPHQVLPTPLNGKVAFRMSTTSSLGHDKAPYYAKVSGPLEKTLAENSVVVLVRAVSLQPRDRKTLLNQKDNTTLGSYCSGVVLSSGTDSVYSPGDRVLASHSGSFQSHVQVSSEFVIKIPETLSFTDACSFIPPMVTAYRAIVEVGRVMYGESVLVHEGASPIGQAAIRLLAGRGITDVWTTASSETENIWITDHLQLPAERILPKVWFESRSILRFQRKLKFDVVVTRTANSPSLLLDYVKSGGRYIMMKSTVTSSEELQPIQFAPENICVATIHTESPDASTLATPESLAYAVNIALPLARLSLNNESAIFPASDLLGIFAKLQNPENHGMTIVKFDDNDVVNVRTYDHRTCDVDSEGTYLIAGGFGGLGRAIARWLVTRGARYLILLSRSGPRSKEAQKLLSELDEQGVNVEAPCCDISDRGALRSVLEACARKMPSIKGCIQSTMIMTELIFQKMTFRDWKTTIDPKVDGSWNLHAELPKGLDFFILFSSIMGILGTVSLTGYNAGNTYEDALAHYRVSEGERAVTINLGGVPDAGYFIDHSDQLNDVQRVEKHALTYVKEICALLEIFCNPKNSFASDPSGCQAVVGLRPTAHWKHLEEVPFTMSQPFWGHMHHVSPLDDIEEDDSAETARRENVLDTAEKLAAAGSLAEAAEIVSKALAHRVSVILGTSEDRLDEQKPMHSYGIDSLSAIDIRNWVGKMFNVDMPVFDILGGATFASAGMEIAHKTRVASKRLKD